MNTSFYWVVGINSLGREIYLIFPPNYTNAKVEQEKTKIMTKYFANLFIWATFNRDIIYKFIGI
jgi:hypothetical protein